MGFRRIPRGAVLGGGAAVIATTVLATTGIGQAAAANGPTIYLSHHGAPSSCHIGAEGTREDGRSFKAGIGRPTCDGTLELPMLKKDTQLTVYALVESPWIGRDKKVFTVTGTLDNEGKIDNDTAICFLAKAGGQVIYTDMSPKGGDCNGD
jgi:hypothetical protein